MGLCTFDPLVGTSIDSSDKVAIDNTIFFLSLLQIFQSSTGNLVNLGWNSTQTFTGTNLRRPTGTYPHAHIKIKNTLV